MLSVASHKTLAVPFMKFLYFHLNQVNISFEIRGKHNVTVMCSCSLESQLHLGCT